MSKYDAKPPQCFEKKPNAKPRHALRLLRLKRPNSHDQRIYYCADCDIAYAPRLVAIDTSMLLGRQPYELSPHEIRCPEHPESLKGKSDGLET